MEKQLTTWGKVRRCGLHWKCHRMCSIFQWSQPCVRQIRSKLGLPPKVVANSPNDSILLMQISAIYCHTTAMHNAARARTKTKDYVANVWVHLTHMNNGYLHYECTRRMIYGCAHMNNWIEGERSGYSHWLCNVHCIYSLRRRQQRRVEQEEKKNKKTLNAFFRLHKKWTLHWPYNINYGCLSCIRVNPYPSHHKRCILLEYKNLALCLALTMPTLTALTSINTGKRPRQNWHASCKCWSDVSHTTKRNVEYHVRCAVVCEPTSLLTASIFYIVGIDEPLVPFRQYFHIITLYGMSRFVANEEAI